MRIFTVILLLLLSLPTYSQKWRDYAKESIGFACSYSGISTLPVDKVTFILMDEKYEKLRPYIYSSLPANQFLGVVTLEYLEKEELLELSEKELNRIEEIKLSDDNVAVCAGCVYKDTVSLKALLNRRKRHPMYKRAQWWLKQYIKES